MTINSHSASYTKTTFWEQGQKKKLVFITLPGIIKTATRQGKFMPHGGAR